MKKTIRLGKNSLITEKGLVTKKEALKAFASGWMENAKKNKKFYNANKINTLVFKQNRLKAIRKV